MATKAEHVTALKAKHSSLTKMVNGVESTLIHKTSIFIRKPTETDKSYSGINSK